jgi:hypothetical protein
MQSADSSLGLSWWLLYQMPGKLQGFKLSEPLGFGWTRLLAATAYDEFIYTLIRQFAQPFRPKKPRCTPGCALVFATKIA